MNYFVTAIGTDSGKTLVASILCEALRADYWKPVQAGLPRDTDTVRSLVSNEKTVLHPERFVFKTPASPHAAARIENIQVRLSDFRLPETASPLVIEGAGGCMVPLNDEDVMVDLMVTLKARIVVVSNLYLGSINHTLLTVEALQRRNLPLAGLVFNGDANEDSERIILLRTGLPCLMRISKEPAINPSVVSRYASHLKKELNG